MPLSADSLRKFLLQRGVSGDVKITADTPLFSSGLLDSASMVELIAFVEDEAGIRIDFGDVTIENFDTMDRIVRFSNS